MISIINFLTNFCKFCNSLSPLEIWHGVYLKLVLMNNKVKLKCRNVNVKSQIQIIFRKRDINLQLFRRRISKFVIYRKITWNHLSSTFFIQALSVSVRACVEIMLLSISIHSFKNKFVEFYTTCINSLRIRSFCRFF